MSSIGVAAVFAAAVVATGSSPRAGLDAHGGSTASVDTIAYTGADADIFTIRADGSHKRRIASDADSPAWSPDGRHVAYSKLGGGIWIVREDATGHRRLTTPPAAVVDTEQGPMRVSGIDTGPSWAPDGRRIVFQRESFAGEGGVDLFTVEVRTRRLARLTRSPGVPEFDPSWSPDEKTIAFSQEAGIRMLDLSSRRLRWLTHNNYDDANPDWSPDGTKLAYSRSIGHDGAIVVVKPDGSAPRLIITAAGAAIGGPSWSPDGRRLAYNTFGTGEGADRRPGELIVSGADGKNPRVLVRDGGEPDWRPRPGSHLTYVRIPG